MVEKVIVPGPPSQPSGIFHEIASFFLTVSANFGNTANNIRDQWLLGEFLYNPFRQLHDFFRDVSDKFYDVDDEYVYYKAWVDSIVSGFTFRNILIAIWPGFTSISMYPRDWIVNALVLVDTTVLEFFTMPVWWTFHKLRQVSPEHASFLDSPALWFLNTLFGLSVDIMKIITNPIGWFQSKLLAMSPFMSTFLWATGVWLNSYLRIVSLNIGYIIDNPSAFIFNLIYLMSNEGYHLLMSPAFIIKKWVSSFFGVSDIFWTNPAYYITVWVFDVVELFFLSFKVRMSNLLIRLILEFI